MTMQHLQRFFYILLGIGLLNFVSCDSDPKETYDIKKEVKVYYNDFPIPDFLKSGWEQWSHLFQKDSNYVNEFSLAHLPASYYADWRPASTLPTNSKMIRKADLDIHFFPLDQDTTGQFQYVHEYSCKYSPDNYRYADVAYPNPCLRKNARAKARVVLKNKSTQPKTVNCRLFYQNTSYWFSTAKGLDLVNKLYLENYYGGSNNQQVTLAPGEEKTIFVDYVIGQDPKRDEWARKKFYGPARPGAYEFMLWATEDTTDVLVQDSLDYRKVNPFAYFQEQLTNGNLDVMDKVAHTAAAHFKFFFLQEDFSRKNIYKPNDVYLLSDRDAKPLCDTCTGYFRNVIADEWKPDDFFKGHISKAPWVKAAYGGRKENVRIDENGIYLKSPKSTEKDKQKTWGEVKFGPSFLYGTIKVVAKFSQLRNKETHTPTGIVHNLWLYQFNHPYAKPIPDHPYAHLTNTRGLQPYEIDIEIWSKIYSENWGGGSAINYSIVDYMRYADALVKPGEEKDIEGAEVDRLNNVQLNYPGTELLDREFFNQYHLYEIIWMPYHIIYKIDGKEMAKIDWRMAKIPDEYAFLWIGSPIYQDGTYYSQNSIPFLPTDRFTHIRYISIE